MISASADGVALSPYSSSNMYDSRCQGGSKRTALEVQQGTTAHHTLSFQIQKHSGDNLYSHFTQEVLKLCKDHEILLICLPPNSAHLAQPLDVCFFGPRLAKKSPQLTQPERNEADMLAQSVAAGDIHPKTTLVPATPPEAKQTEDLVQPKNRGCKSLGFDQCEADNSHHFLLRSVAADDIHPKTTLVPATPPEAKQTEDLVQPKNRGCKSLGFDQCEADNSHHFLL
ncbi:hypothetical protein PR048_007436, partial [Dryococelus australis]